MKKKTALIFLTLAVSALCLFGAWGCTQAKSISFAKDFYAVREGESVVPEVQIDPEVSYTLETAFEGVAVVENGALKGVKRGVTILTARSGAVSASVKVEVLAADGTSTDPGGDKARVLYVIDEINNNYYTNYVRFGERTPSLILEKNGYEFRGWYTDNTYTTPFDFDAPIDADVKIYGKYSLVQGVDTPLTYRKSDGYLLVTGLKYTGVPYTEIEIPQTAFEDGEEMEVVGLDEKALSGLKSLTTIRMPYVKILGSGALSNCPKLQYVTANNGLTFVGSGVLNGSKWLTNAQLDTVTVGGVKRYHGAQLGNCYLYAVNNAKEIFLTDTPTVTVFAEAAIPYGAKIHVPKSLETYYRNHPNLVDFKENIYAY